jgi:hypothetical protein
VQGLFKAPTIIDAVTVVLKISTSMRRKKLTCSLDQCLPIIRHRRGGQGQMVETVKL